MKQKITTVLFLLITAFTSAQITYSGFIDKYPIEFVTNVYSDGEGRAIYTYSNFDTPIVLNAKQKGNTLVFTEKDKNNKPSAQITFQNYNSKSDKLKGTWKDLNSGKELQIQLNKTFDAGSKEMTEWSNKEILQPVSFKDKYFKLVLSKQKDDYEAKVTAVKILEKKTDKLLQTFNVECQLLGLNNINIEDYNFDGIEDFSVYEAGAAGPNTSSLYFLYNPKTGKYFESSFTGTSLEFDSKTKRIYERNQCCAGSSVIEAEYKVVNNKMVLIKQTCFKYDPKLNDLKKVKCD
ncbi:hypothetical protein L1276_000720 [Flavobacterium sp. HSC-32F16]|uniref:XAC2610-related protein n=1 Tax=Flavobacterium sp. HSC-32F16 TaxID=2910964 RepID=UPI0020A4A692|nr:hypothetical protein [Flavobacterium sp. HSC-32F16]MCP2025580.1 hypothetical protein [Flavobacterium sp. HSC-32F16]